VCTAAQQAVHVNKMADSPKKSQKHEYFSTVSEKEIEEPGIPISTPKSQIGAAMCLGNVVQEKGH